MTVLRSTLRLCRTPALAAVGLGALAAGPALAATPAFQQAPGRVVLALDTASQSQSIPTSEAVLPDGGVVIGGSGTPGPLATSGFATILSYAAKLKPDGQLDTSFGRGGIAKIPGLIGGPSQIIRQPDGRLLVVGAGQPNTSRLPLMTLARLNADGSPDASFGSGGVETLGIQEGDAALLASGDIVATGGAGTTGLVSALDPTQLGDDRWDVVELTPGGALAPAFGSGGVVTLPPVAASGQSLAVAPNGDIVTSGVVELTATKIVEQLTALTPSGAVDPSFNSGQPVTVPGNTGTGVFAVEPDSSTLVEVGNGTTAGVVRGVVRYTAAGALDPTFGAMGILTFPSGSPLKSVGSQLLPLAGGGLLEIDTSSAVPGVRVTRLTASGDVDPTLGGPGGLQVGLAFGGADQLPFFGTVNPQSVAGLDQDSFSGTVLQRPDGSYVAVGAVSVVETTGSGDGPSIDRLAVEALTSAFKPDPSFGGPATALRVRLAVPVQSAATAIHRHQIRVTLTASQPGDARIVVRAGGHIVAQSLLPVLRIGASTLPVVMTRSGLKWLRAHPRSRLSLTTEARDLLTSTATSTATGALR
jgi:uncharacterized delta-60 repeat protein